MGGEEGREGRARESGKRDKFFFFNVAPERASESSGHAEQTPRGESEEWMWVGEEGKQFREKGQVLFFLRSS